MGLKLPSNPYLVSIAHICLPIFIEYNWVVTNLDKKNGFSKHPYLIIIVLFFKQHHSPILFPPCNSLMVDWRNL